MEKNPLINWFEIPAKDIQQAQSFYESIFGYRLLAFQTPHEMRVFPLQDMSTGGAICYKPGFYTPSADGILIYLNANPDIQAVLDKVVAAGGAVIVPKTKISDEHGYIAIIIDTEGNRIGLQAQK